MFLKKISFNFKKIHFRLTFLFSLIFIIASLVLFTFSFFTLYSSMKAEDSGNMRRRLLNYWAVFQSGGINAISEEIKVDSFLYGDRAFFIRIADSKNKTLFLKYPENWKSFNIEKLSRLPLSDFSQEITLSSKTNAFKLEISSVKLSSKYILQIGMSTARRLYFLNIYQRNFILLLILLVIFSIVSGAFFSGRALKPLRDLSSILKRIVETGDFSKRVEKRKGRDDLDEIIILFNTMLTRIESLILQMKGTFDSVAHDLRTPMTRMRGLAELALQDPANNKRLTEALSSSLEESEKILSMLNTMMDISEAESGILHLNLQAIEVKKVLTDLIDIYAYIGEEKGLHISLSCTEDNITIQADPVRFRQAVGNILDNAVKYSPDNSKITVTVQKTADNCTISVTDYGPGIDKNEIPFIWDRLYRSPSKKGIPGMGLGLSLVKAVVSAHGGSVEVVSQREGKTVFSLSFPLTRNKIITKL